MRTHALTVLRKAFSYLSGLYSIFVFIRDEFLSEELANSLKLGNLIGKNLSMDNILWFWFLLIAVILYIPEITSFIKRTFCVNNDFVHINLIPRNGQIHEGLWNSYHAWLEITGDMEGDEKYTAILQKLESEKDNAVTNHLFQVTKSSSPRLKIIGEKLLIAETDVANIVISLKDGKSKSLPENINKFYFEIVLLKGKMKAKEYKGYLIGSYSDLHIESV